jgi:predicted RND superfamily exporter protein
MRSVSQLAQWLLSRRQPLLIAAACLIAVAVFGARGLSFSMEYRDFFNHSDARVLEFDKIQASYARADNILLVIAPESRRVFTRETLQAVDWLTQKAWRLPYATRVDSLTNYQHSTATADQVHVGDLAGNPGRLSDEQLDEVKRVALNDVLLVNRMVSSQGHVTGVNVTFRTPGQRGGVETRAAVDAARRLAEEFRATFPAIEVFLSGTLTVSHAFYEVTMKDLVTLIPLMIVVLAVVLTLVMRSVVGAAVTFLVVAGSTVIAFGVAGMFGMRLTPPAAAAAPIMMTLAIADCVHLFSTYEARLRDGLDRVAAMRESVTVNFGPVTLTSLTTAVGFATMNLADSPPFHDLGNLVVIGVVAAYALSLTVFTSVMSMLPLRPQGLRNERPPLMHRYAEFAVSNRRSLLIGALSMCAGLAWFLPRNELNDEFLKYFDRSVEFRRDNDFITRELTGVYQFIYSLPAAQADGVADPDYLRVLDEFAAWFREQPEVWYVESLTDLLKQINRTVNGGRQEQYQLPQTREQAAQYLLLLEMSLPVGLDLNDRITVGKSASRFVVGVRTLPASRLLDLEVRAERWLQAKAPVHMGALATGPALLFAHIGMSSIRTGLIQEAVAIVLISAVLLVALRSVRIGLLSLIPNVVPAIAAFGLWGLVVGQINMALATVAGMALGIVVDDTIHLLSKYLHARRESGLAPADAVRYAISEVGGAVIATSLTLIAGFLALTPSPFVMNWGMGLLTAMTLFLAMVLDLTMLPGLLLAIDKEEPREVSALALSRN